MICDEIVFFPECHYTIRIFGKSISSVMLVIPEVQLYRLFSRNGNSIIRAISKFLHVELIFLQRYFHIET